MPVVTHSYVHFQTPPGPPPGSPSAPTQITSITKDAGATISFLPGANNAGGAPTSWTVTPYIAGTAQAPQTITAASATSLTGSNGSVYTQVPVTGLANGTAYTFTVHGTNSAGAGAESDPSGANTPLSGLVFGDDFNGPAGGPVDPEWWIYDRCAFLAQSEVAWYKPDHCVLDGASSLKLTAEHTSVTGTTYPSDGNRTVTQPWTSGACQSNAKTWAPTGSNTMTFEARQKVCPEAGSNAIWPGLFWLEGQDYVDAWKTDPQQSGWDDTGKSEIDVAEWNNTGLMSYYSNVAVSSNFYTHSVGMAADPSAAMHVYSVRWKPGATTSWWRDGSQTVTDTHYPASGARLFLMLYLQIRSGTASSPQSCYVDYVRVYDQNLG